MQGDKDVLMRAPVVSLTFTERLSRNAGHPLTQCRTQTAHTSRSRLMSILSTASLDQQPLNRTFLPRQPSLSSASCFAARMGCSSPTASVIAARPTRSRAGTPSIAPTAVSCRGRSTSCSTPYQGMRALQMSVHPDPVLAGDCLLIGQLRCSGLGEVVLTDEPDPAVLEGFFPDFEGVSEECAYGFQSALRVTEALRSDFDSDQGGPKLLLCRLRLIRGGVQREGILLPVPRCPLLIREIFDLLDDVLPITPSGGKAASATGSLKRSSSHAALPSAYGSSMNLAAMVNGGGGVLKRRALVLKNDPDGNGKYIAGLSEIRVRTRQVSKWAICADAKQR